MLNADSCPPIPTKDLIDHCSSVACHSIVPVFDIKTYEMVYEYALFAVGSQYKNEVIYISMRLFLACVCSMVLPHFSPLLGYQIQLKF